MKLIRSCIGTAVLYIFILADFTLQAQTHKAGITQGIADSDGDGIVDAEDQHPLIADVQTISWSIGSLTVGWKFDGSMESLESTLSQQEKETLKASKLDFGALAAVGGELNTKANAQMSLNPLTAFGLLGSGAEVEFRSRFSASGNMAWSKSDQDRASELRRMVGRTQIAQRLSGLNVEFTVLFFNSSDTDSFGENLQLPIRSGDTVAAVAQPVGANGPEPRIRIPANRHRGIPIRFRADLNTTQSLVVLLSIMEKQSPTIAIAETQGSITTKDGEKDAISELSRMEGKIMEGKLCKLTIEADGREFTWNVARRDQRANKPVRLADAFEAINALVMNRGREDTPMLFQHNGFYLRSAFGRDCTIAPVRWWVIAHPDGTVSDVIPSEEIGATIRVRYEFGFPPKMQRWVFSEIASDSWRLAVAGFLLEDGRADVKADRNRAVEFYRRAADLGSPDAISKLGLAYALGVGGLPKDEKKAIELWQKATDLGSADAFSLLGDAYMEGIGGLAKDEKKAAQLWQKAADLGSPSAHSNLDKARAAVTAIVSLPVLEVILKPDTANPLAYDTKSISAKVGQKVKVTFNNNHPTLPQPHNFVLGKVGTKDKMMAIAMSAMTLVDKGYIPDSPDILAHTKLIQPGQSETIEFTLPAAGEYPFFCTFPGHVAIMNGVLTVR